MDLEEERNNKEIKAMKTTLQQLDYVFTIDMSGTKEKIHVILIEKRIP